MEEAEKIQTFKEKLLFKITAFFVLLGTFSLFSFLFLVPFVIDPAFTTIFMQFEERPTDCRTTDMIQRRGTKNCTWSSCREGCTKEVYNCTMIYVDYRVLPQEEVPGTTIDGTESTSPLPLESSSSINEWSVHLANKVKSTHYDDEESGGAPIEWSPDWIDRTSPHKLSRRDTDEATDVPTSTLVPSLNESKWFAGGKLYPNVKGCGYPPFLNCTIFLWRHQTVGATFPCYYSKVEPMMVVSELDMRQVYLNLILATAIPIPSFIISVVYLAFAYFVIYAEEPPEHVTAIPEGGEDLEEEDGDKATLVEEPPDVQEKTLSLEDGLPDIDADDVDIEADELPDKQSSPNNDVPPPPSELIKPAAMMVVRPSSLVPSGPIAAV
ncbi:hypothetical protein B566_EDAN011498 [Ephemera danica]|nr:hypothetical protein B566_EDAN011498 [Ephemera danica]